MGQLVRAANACVHTSVNTVVLMASTARLWLQESLRVDPMPYLLSFRFGYYCTYNTGSGSVVSYPCRTSRCRLSAFQHLAVLLWPSVSTFPFGLSLVGQVSARRNVYLFQLYPPTKLLGVFCYRIPSSCYRRISRIHYHNSGIMPQI